MKMFGVKSLAAGFLFGTVGITTAFAATDIVATNTTTNNITTTDGTATGITATDTTAEISSAVFSSVRVTFNGESLLLRKPLVEVTAVNAAEGIPENTAQNPVGNGENTSLYVSVDELLGKLGYTVNYDSASNTMDIVPGGGSLQNGDGDAAALPTAEKGALVFNLENNPNQTNIAESGAFWVEEAQTLTLSVISDIKGGTVDLFLFDPNGKEQRITVGAECLEKEIALEKGIWKYNCSGIFKDGGTIKIEGRIK